MGFLFGVFIYLLAVLIASVAAPRLNATFATERGIFRLHVLSFASVAVISTVYVLAAPSDTRLASAAAALAAHAIISISFLELWSLSEGGYSVQIILALADGPRRGAELVEGFSGLGEQKREGRIQSLLQLGLVNANEGGVLRLTRAGRIAARSLRFLLATANIEMGA